MKKETNIALITTGAIVVVAGVSAYFFLRKIGMFRKGIKKKPTINPSFEKMNAIKNLKTIISKEESLIETMCPKGSGVMVDCRTGSKFSSGLVQGVWIQRRRSINGMRRTLNDTVQNTKVKKYGEGFIESFESLVDRKFDPKHYNKNTDWYREYLSGGGSAI
jgi:hypothetical protein